MKFCFRASHVTLTDLPELLPLLKINCAENTSIIQGVTEVQQLTWGNTQQIQAIQVPDVILLADCIYYGEVSVIWNFGMFHVSLLFYE